jgi:hypothetical protein
MKELTVCAMTPEILGLDYYVEENARLTILNHDFRAALENIVDTNGSKWAIAQAKVALSRFQKIMTNYEKTR